MAEEVVPAEPLVGEHVVRAARRVFGHADLAPVGLAAVAHEARLAPALVERHVRMVEHMRLLFALSGDSRRERIWRAERERVMQCFQFSSLAALYAANTNHHHNLAAQSQCDLQFGRAMKSDSPDALRYVWGEALVVELLKLQILRIDPLSSEAGRSQALEHAKDLGLDACKDCKGCKCGVGIDLMGKVIRPLLQGAGE